MCVSGMIMMWGGDKTNIPAGWLECSGQLVSQSQYPDLFAAIGNNFGVTTSASEFYLPDLRGRFVRGVDDGADRDPDEASRTDMQDPTKLSSGVGSIQSHALEQHTHGYNQMSSGGDQVDDGSHLSNSWVASGDVDGASTSTETRPINAYLYFIIKY